MPDRQSVIRYEQRAQLVRDALQRLWGDELPPGRDANLHVLVDAVAADDEAGRSSGVVVQGDELQLAQLQRLLSSSGDVDQRMMMLPPQLQRRLRGGASESRPVVDPGAPGG